MATKPNPVSIIRQILRAEVLVGLGFFAGSAFGGLGYGVYAGLFGINLCG